MSLSIFDYAKVEDEIVIYGLKEGEKCPLRLVIPEGVTIIGTAAFESAWLEELVLPASLKTIGEGAFCNCKDLSEVFFAARCELYEIEAGAFAYCSSLERVSLPKKLHTIGEEAFYECALEAILIPESVKVIGEDAFDGDRMYSVTVSGSSFGREFHENFAGENPSVIYTDDVFKKKTVKTMPTTDTEKIKDIKIIPPKKTAPTAPKAASVAPKTAPLAHVRPASENSAGEEYTPLSKFVTEPYDGGLKIVKCLDKELTELILPPEIVMIDHKAFYLHNNLRRFKAGRTLKIIFNYAFGSCPALSEVEYSIHTAVCEGAFSGCPLTKATLTPIVYDGAFRATRVKEIEFKGLDWGEVREIPNSVLSHSDLRSVDLPASVTSIGRSAFAFCNELTRVTYRGNINYMAAGVFESCPKLEEFTMPNGVSGVPACAFSFCSGLKRVKITDRPGEIGKMAFYRCDSLRELVIPKGIYRIGEAAVMSSSLERVVFEGRTFDEVKKLFGFSWLVMSSLKVDIVCLDTTYTKVRFIQ